MEEKRVASRRVYLTIFSLLVCSWVWVPTPSEAQGTPGQNAICPNSSGCSVPVGSSAFIDAIAFASQGDFCAVLQFVLLNKVPAAGAVIDARGLPAASVNMTCAASPWGSGTGYVNKPSTILLPAGAITIPTSWILPNGTRLIGADSQPITIGGGATSLTAIQACTTSITGCSINFSGTMIQFGDSHCPSGVCKGISVENLSLNGNGLTITGISNSNSKELTYVDHVTLYQILGTGLQISTTGADNSGPYSNVSFDTGSYSPQVTSTACASINGTSGTRGLHGLSCIGESTNGSVGVYLDASNNSLEDIRIMGFDDGIRVGSQAVARSNVLLNIFGDTDQNGTNPIINVVRISNAGGSTPNVSDLSIMGVTNAGTNARTVEDDLTSTTLSDPSVGMYALGEPKSGGYSRFTTSPNAVTWVVGNPTNQNMPSGACATGSLYSNISGSGSQKALWVCKPGNTWTGIE